MKPLRAGWPLIGAVLFVVYAALLIWNNYSTQVQLRESALAGLRLDAEKRAAAISYFFFERRNDLQDLAASREISAFFANKALQMSMEYGLRANLLAIGQTFERLRLQKTLGRIPIYGRMALVDPDGEVLVEAGRAGTQAAEPARLLTPGATSPAILFDQASGNLVATAPVYFKDVYAGQVIAWSDASQLHRHLVEPGVSVDQDELLITDHGELVSADERNPEHDAAVVASARSLFVDANLVRGVGGDLWAQNGLVGAKLPVAGTPFSLAIVVPEEAAFRKAAPVAFLLAAGSVPLIVLVAAFFLGRLRRLNAALRSRYIESDRRRGDDRRRGELQGKYTELENEVRRRESVERELRLQREQLEVRTRELQAAMEEAHHLAMYDGLTGLSNRVLFRESLRQAIGTAKKNGRTLAVLFLDVDRFKRINDTLGHTAGDQLLREVARRVEHCIRQSDVVSRAAQGGRSAYVARQGGDEFTVLLTELGEPVQAATVARRIIEALARSISLDGHEVVVTGSVGISIYPGDGEDVDTLLKNADAAMYHAKEKGRNQYQFYEESMHATAMRRLAIESEMRQAIEQEQFEVFYQPMMDPLADRIVGVEALLRWHHPRRGLVSPGEFIPVAEESGLIVPLTEYVLNRACRQIAAWDRETGMQISVAVNLSGRTLALADVYDMIDRSLRAADAPANLLELELTESVLMESRETAQRLMERLKQHGVRVSIDDFGTGYSSLSYLKTLVIDTLKIDRSFVQDLPGDRDSEAIVRTIVAMARTLNLRVVAEGVETREQYAFLCEVGVDLVQGFLFGKPAPEPEVTRRLLESAARGASSAREGRTGADGEGVPAVWAPAPAIHEPLRPSLEQAA